MLLALIFIILLAPLSSVEVFISAPISNTTGVSYHHLVSYSIVDQEISKSQLNDRIDELRSEGQVYPSRLSYLEIKLKNPSISNQPWKSYQSILDTGSIFNILPLSVVRQLSLPLGSECQFQWTGNNNVDQGNYTVAALEIGGIQHDVIFCVPKNRFDILLNSNFLFLFKQCLCLPELVPFPDFQKCIGREGKFLGNWDHEYVFP